MNIQAESRDLWPDFETGARPTSSWRDECCEVEVGYLASQLLLPHELPSYAAEGSRFWQRWVRRLRCGVSRDCRVIRNACGGASVAQLRAQSALG